MKISEIKITKKGRYALFLEGEFVFSVTADQILEDKIREGKEITQEELEEIRRKSGAYFAKERAINLLSARSYSRFLLYKKLKDYADEDIVWQIIDRMEELGLVDDEEYAKNRASDMYKIKKYGKIRVKRDLKERGISDEIIEKTAQELEPNNNSEILYDLIDKKYFRNFKSISTKEDYFKAKKRTEDALARRGFSFDEIYKAIAKYLDNQEINFDSLSYENGYY